MQFKTRETRYLALSGICLAISVIMPNIFHLAGPQGGKMFLPLFWGVAIAALIVPMKYAVLVGLLAPIASHLISAMPPVPMLYFMLVELTVYAISVRLISRRLNPFLSIFFGLVISRSCYILAAAIIGQLFQLPPMFSSLTALCAGVLVSLPGIIMQVVLVPAIYHIYQKVSHIELVADRNH